MTTLESDNGNRGSRGTRPQSTVGRSARLKALAATCAIGFASMSSHAAGLPGMRGADHFGLTVPNLQEAVDFFVKVIGCEAAAFKLGPFKAEDDWMNVHLNVNPRAEIGQFQFVRCGHGTNLEIFEYSAPGQSRTPPKNSDVGGHHLAFYVDDMDKAVSHLKANNVKMLGEPSVFKEGPAAGLTWMYFLAPWGMQLEVVSHPKGMAYQKNGKFLLWDPRTPEK
jgi:catechol 2,3-dioxygenase-like lactoylglutathione lyase family enzyme